LRLVLSNSFSAPGAADSARVWRVTTPTYRSVASDGSLGGAVGRVSVTVVNDSSCTRCFQVADLLASQLAQIGVNVQKPAVLEYNSTEGQAFVKTYNLTRVPAIVFSKDLSEYPEIAKRFVGNATNPDGSPVRGIGVRAPDGSYIVVETVPPYLEVGLGRVVGLTDVIYVTLNDTCARRCYDPSSHKDLLYGSFGVVFNNELTYPFNSTEGAKLVAQYNITKVPTIVLSREALRYNGLGSAWLQIPLGTLKTDGRLVFRNMDALGNVTYYDLVQNKLMNWIPDNVTVVNPLAPANST
jgi:hypothetical protein